MTNEERIFLEDELDKLEILEEQGVLGGIEIKKLKEIRSLLGKEESVSAFEEILLLNGIKNEIKRLQELKKGGDKVALIVQQDLVELLLKKLFGENLKVEM